MSSEPMTAAADGSTMTTDASPASGRAAMSTFNPTPFPPAGRENPAVDHYDREQAAARHLAALRSPRVPIERIILVRVDGKRETVVVDPYAAAASAAASPEPNGDCRLDTIQRKVVSLLVGGERKTKKQLAAATGSNRVYLLKSGGIDEMVRWDVLAVVESNKYELTDFGNAIAAEMSEGE